jgi:hypothetical protein
MTLRRYPTSVLPWHSTAYQPQHAPDPLVAIGTSLASLETYLIEATSVKRGREVNGGGGFWGLGLAVGVGQTSLGGGCRSGWDHGPTDAMPRDGWVYGVG